MKVSPVPVFLAGFCLVAVVMALFLTFPPSEEDMRTAAAESFSEASVTYFDRHGCAQVSGNAYDCHFERGYNEGTSSWHKGTFTKQDGEWKYSG